MSLAPCPIVPHDIFIFFPKSLFSPGSGEKKGVCKYDHLQIWKLEFFGPGVLHVFAFFKPTTQQERTDESSESLPMILTTEGMTKIIILALSLVSEMLPHHVIDVFIWIWPVLVYKYLMRATRCRS